MSTIVAISTAPGNAGIGIIRMSGEDCFEILKKIFIPKNEGEIKGYTMKYGNIINNKTKEIIDEVLVSYFVSPKSYTKENMCEINSHGGMIVEKLILEECIRNGATLAEPGEFTKRAFLNGRIDLSQAEAIIDIINSKTEKEMEVAQRHLDGKLSNKINEIKDILLDLMSDIEASIDYPEYDIEETTNKKIKEVLKDVNEKLKKLESSFSIGKILKDGIKTSIIGKPNVGKSSLLNLILGEERAIVSNIEGTTRDTIEEYVNIKGIPLKLIDTAGIRKTNDEIEKIGVKKSKDIINNADLIIAVFDDSRAFDDEDKEIIKLIEGKKAIIVINKVDLKKGYIKNNPIIKELKNIKVDFSTVDDIGFDVLQNKILELFDAKQIEIDDSEIVTSQRQKEYIIKARNATKEAKEAINNDMPLDITTVCIKEILENLLSITGENVSENIINEIFKKFCLGK